jgi:PIN domain nuclease of toxin-antitoxin system
MLVLDTCVLVFDALTPTRLSEKARVALDEAEVQGALFCSDISLWEIAMLVHKGRLDPGTDYLSFIRTALTARGIVALPITVEIAHLSVSLPSVAHKDPADRIIAATAAHHRAPLVTCDESLLGAEGVDTLW